MSRSSPRSRRRAFSLLEILAVLVLMGILASAAALGLRRTRRVETPAQFQERLDAWAEQGRALAIREQRPWAIELHPGAATLMLHPDGETVSRLCELPRGWELIAVRGDRLDWSGQPMLIPLDRHGQGASIALEWRDPDQHYRFLVISGLTGQSRWFERKEEADAWFAPRVQSP